MQGQIMVAKKQTSFYIKHFFYQNQESHFTKRPPSDLADTERGATSYVS
jgi:hypothetical protein